MNYFGKGGKFGKDGSKGNKGGSGKGFPKGDTGKVGKFGKTRKGCQSKDGKAKGTCGSKSQPAYFDPQCSSCGQWGHKKKYCPNRTQVGVVDQQLLQSLPSADLPRIGTFRQGVFVARRCWCCSWLCGV